MLRPLCFSCFLTLALTSYAHPLEHWSRRFQDSDSYVFQDIVFNGNSFVAVGTIGSTINSTQGFILTSDTGANWSSTSAPPLLAVTFGDSDFVAVGKTGTLMTSPDSVTWTTQNSGTTNTLIDVTSGNGTFVAIGSTNLVLTSTNGATWSSQVLPVTQVTHVVFGNGVFLLTASPTNNYRSPDGLIWTPVEQPPQPPLVIEFISNEFISLSANRQIFSSVNGASWILRGTNRGFRTSGVAFGNGFYVLASGSLSIEYASTLNNWEIVSATPTTVGKAAFGHGTFIVAGSGSVYQSDPIVNLKMLASRKLWVEAFAPGTLQIQSVSALGASNDWQVLTNLTITNSPFLWTNNITSGDQEFYRAQIIP